ncbi:nuclease domain-containing protein [Vibrio rhizosphaerae]|uniref:Nuclease domain-containing protein n=1 Tax=Vibrio rhizosphaerae TaxID=398736 RepID=A0ABU4IXA5_9VIBR|nr:nuclease domain-containing protein [Vibrio rhizosphaerae]MDW6094035.1 nuclease domain-containing protein [Vibrio rhizosphaerae]
MKAAKGQGCTLRLSGICNFNPETTVACHIGKIRGMALKCGDNMVVFACNNCHDVIDGRVNHGIPDGELAQDKLRALEETQRILIDIGLISVG